MNTENTYKKENMKKMIQDTMCQRVSAPNRKRTRQRHLWQ